MLDLIEGWLRHKSDMVNLEAARVICEMRGVTSSQLTKAISGRSNTDLCHFTALLMAT